MLPDFVFQAIRYADANTIELPSNLRIRARRVGALKAFGDIPAGDLPTIGAAYNSAIVEILTAFFADKANLVSSRNAFTRTMIDAFGMVFDLGWTDGGKPFPIEEDAQSWLNARISQEGGYIAMLFQEAKTLRKESGFDYFSWITARADGYVRTLKEIYNAAKMWAMKNIMVTFDGDDGAESCEDCQKLKGKRHRMSWFINRNYVPPAGVGLACHPGRRCQHGLFDDNGNQVTA